MLLYENRTVVDDLLVYKVSDNECFLVVNASNKDKDYEWLLKNKDGFDVEIWTVRMHTPGCVQGPKAKQR